MATDAGCWLGAQLSTPPSRGLSTWLGLPHIMAAGPKRDPVRSRITVYDPALWCGVISRCALLVKVDTKSRPASRGGDPDPGSCPGESSSHCRRASNVVEIVTAAWEEYSLSRRPWNHLQAASLFRLFTAVSSHLESARRLLRLKHCNAFLKNPVFRSLTFISVFLNRCF